MDGVFVNSVGVFTGIEYIVKKEFLLQLVIRFKREIIEIIKQRLKILMEFIWAYFLKY